MRHAFSAPIEYEHANKRLLSIRLSFSLPAVSRTTSRRRHSFLPFEQAGVSNRRLARRHLRGRWLLTSLVISPIPSYFAYLLPACPFVYSTSSCTCRRVFERNVALALCYVYESMVFLNVF